MDRKKEQLAMPVGTASNRLVKDILFNFITKADERCFHCNGELSRDNFSIEHKIPWLDSADPVALFFDLDNIAFSHLSCNIGAARKPHRSPLSQRERWSAHKRKSYTTEKRREKKRRSGH